MSAGIPTCSNQAENCIDDTQSNAYLREREIPVPAPNENQIRQINIEQLNHGYLVRVGCQTVAIENSGKLIQMLSAYISNPAETEKKYYEKTLL